jgi:lipid II:glycine glycyltransferase (peptidoglycan interpeptide bridge formation enzyme)
MKIGENTEIKVDLKTIIAIVMITSTFVGMYYTLQADIEIAKSEPKAAIERLEYDLREEWNEKMIINLEERVEILEESQDLLREEVKITSTMLKDGTEKDDKFAELNKQMELLKKRKPTVIIKEVPKKRKW